MHTGMQAHRHAGHAGKDTCTHLQCQLIKRRLHPLARPCARLDVQSTKPTRSLPYTRTLLCCAALLLRACERACMAVSESTCLEALRSILLPTSRITGLCGHICTAAGHGPPGRLAARFGLQILYCHTHTHTHARKHGCTHGTRPRRRCNGWLCARLHWSRPTGTTNTS